ncbi:hypothetical protein C8J57DRAFT_1324989 [Mycena rebaudengoi]|nr:hypothetical protein C8J57DRAFT_1324989 [Mycena rebaudengoi]
MLVPAPLPVHPILLFLTPFSCLSPCAYGAKIPLSSKLNQSARSLLTQSFFPSESLAFDWGPWMCTEARGMEITAENSLALGSSIGGLSAIPISINYSRPAIRALRTAMADVIVVINWSAELDESLISLGPRFGSPLMHRRYA